MIDQIEGIKQLIHHKASGDGTKPFAGDDRIHRATLKRVTTWIGSGKCPWVELDNSDVVVQLSHKERWALYRVAAYALVQSGVTYSELADEPPPTSAILVEHIAIQRMVERVQEWKSKMRRKVSVNVPHTAPCATPDEYVDRIDAIVRSGCQLNE